MEWCGQMDLNKLGDWFRANKLTLNANKSNCILFHAKKNKTLPISLMVNNVELPLVHNIKFLGVWVDRNLDLLCTFLFSFEVWNICLGPYGLKHNS